MSSSEPIAGTGAGRRYLTTFAAAAAGFLALLLALCWATDPTGLLRAEGLSPGLCGPGIPNWEERHVKPLIAAGQRPEEIVLGSSLAVRGFRPEAFEGRRVANLGISAGGVSEIDRLARFAAARGGLRRAWIEARFLAFTEPALPESRMPLPGAGLAGRNFALRYGLFDWRALSAAIRTSVFVRTCRTPPIDTMGFFPADASPHIPVRISPAALDTLRRTWSQASSGRQATVEARLARLDRLLADLRAQGVEPVVFIPPLPSAQRTALAGSLHEPLYREWRAALIRIAARRGARLVGADDPAFLRAIPAGPCPSVPAEDCLFDQTRHFRPAVGAAIVRAALGS